ncbi:MAG: 16S rRNA (adenine(1518)-N(6)/adenine(1519)-N(6))-dimethyltransferase RsmA [Deferribacteraceae bacterium]|jgi:16S rRNA (adenine1518-N6/adenine1519-N6)-dimethyltransferase|nr:16S rRNA (adenine(1518)-N(6)/adenine(1519)-N(6))-dimethyltransferase RsmA [Deferribacteraceae bacterium]
MSELIQRFKSEYLRTKKALGQHFLTNQHFIEEIACAADLSADSPAVEIGPGCGVLTAALAAYTQRLTAIELDDNAAAFLEANKAEFFPQLRLIHADVLTVDMATLYAEPAGLITDTDKVSIIGNLPYNLSVKIVEHCTASIGSIRKMVFMFQKEVAALIASAPCSKDYSSLSVFCSYHYEIKKIRDISGGNFWPNASVYSTVLEFIPKPPALTQDEEKDFFALVYKAFRQKRKTLRNNLKDYQALPAVLAKYGKSESVRAEELSLEDFIGIWRALS